MNKIIKEEGKGVRNEQSSFLSIQLPPLYHAKAAEEQGDQIYLDQPDDHLIEQYTDWSKDQ